MPSADWRRPPSPLSFSSSLCCFNTRVAMKLQIASQPASQGQSPFFRLPAEIRERILREAFGGRAVHIELRLQPILRPLSPRQDTTDQTSGQQYQAGFLRSLFHRIRPPKFKIKPYHGKGEVTEWRWYGGICRRNVPKLCGQRQRPYDGSVPLYQARDDCVAEFARGEAGESQRVGVLGFLLSCKKGYVIKQAPPYLLASSQPKNEPNLTCPAITSPSRPSTPQTPSFSNTGPPP